VNGVTYIQPVLPVLFLAAGFTMFRYWRRTKGRLPLGPGLALIGLFLFAWPPAACLATRVFEAHFPPLDVPAGNPGAIVVLASSVVAARPPMPSRLGADTLERCQYAAWLHQHWKPLPILACGGDATSEQPAYAITMREALVREGVPASDIWVEDQSRSTYENALYGARILHARGVTAIALVTDGYHMLRADKCFRKQYLQVSPAPSDYRSYHTFQLDDLLPSWEPISWNEDLAHETVGMAWYWFHGWI
jgi:uncharacterized SAM-binding protein YcdF (DUF218 family)